MTLMGLFDIFRSRPPIRDRDELAQFIDENAAFLVQKGIYEYARARAGHYAKVLFKEPEFVEAVERSRWTAYPLGLAMVGELVEGVLRPLAADADRSRQLETLRALVLSVFDRYPTPAVARRGELEPEARRARAPAAADRPASAEAGLRHPGAVCRGLFRPDADPPEAARERISDPAQLSEGDFVQHP